MGLSLGADASPREPDAPRLVDEAPALTSAAWLPEGGWPELDELAAEHRGLLARRSEVSAELAELRELYEREDKEHREAMAAHFRGGSAEAPALTPPEERRAALDNAQARRRAVNDALDGFLKDATARIEAEAVGWQGKLESRREAAAEQRREAERLLIEARAEEVRVARLEEWLIRNAGLHERRSFRAIPNMRYVAWDHIQSWTPQPESEEDGRPQLVDPPRRPEWDAEHQAARAAMARRAREEEREQHPERFAPPPGTTQLRHPLALTEEEE